MNRVVWLLVVSAAVLWAARAGKASGTDDDDERTDTEILGISMKDIDRMVESTKPKRPEPAKLTLGDEFMEESPMEGGGDAAILADQQYQQALKFLERGRPQGGEARRAAYRLIDQAASAGHKDAMKMMGYAHLFGDRARWSLDEARAIFQQLDQNGSPDAQLALGFMHSTGLGVPNTDQARALVYFTFSALGGNPLAQMALGYRYHAGVGVPANCETALTYYRKVADRVASSVRFSTSLAIQRIRLTDEMEPSSTNTPTGPMDANLLEYYRLLADKGDVSAQVGLGQLFLTGGRGVEQNFDEANKYFSAAAESGHPNAFAYLGKMYLDGTGPTPQDNTTAFQFFLKSADKSNQMGQAGLGIMYLQGRGVKQDYEKALRLFSLAAEQGWVEGQLYLGHMYYRGLGVKTDYKLALKYYQMAAQNGHILAYYNLAVMHAIGLGAARSCNSAVEFYKNVAERGRWSERMMEAYAAYKEGRADEAAMKYLFLAELGYEPAQTNFAYILDRGEAGSLFPQSQGELLSRALVHWQRSANQEYVIARVKLGDYHYYGMGTEEDAGTAAQHYKVAAERHASAQAMFNLGWMHEQGLGLPRDIYLAKRWYDAAMEQSTDAVAPVSLALAKLAFVFIADYLGKLPVLSVVMRWLERVVGEDWDIYAMTACLGGVVLIAVRMMQNRNAHRQDDDDEDDAAANVAPDPFMD